MIYEMYRDETKRKETKGEKQSEIKSCVEESASKSKSLSNQNGG